MSQKDGLSLLAWHMLYSYRHNYPLLGTDQLEKEGCFMFIIAQIPFVDFRLLSKEEFTDCIFPNTFPKKMSKSTYYRYFGEEKNRYMPNQLPLSERQFFDAHKILHSDYYGVKGDAS